MSLCLSLSCAGGCKCCRTVWATVSRLCLGTKACCPVLCLWFHCMVVSMSVAGWPPGSTCVRCEGRDRWWTVGRTKQVMRHQPPQYNLYHRTWKKVGIFLAYSVACRLTIDRYVKHWTIFKNIMYYLSIYFMYVVSWNNKLNNLHICLEIL